MPEHEGFAMEFIFNAWYVAGFGHEIRRGAVLRRLMLGQPVALFRDSQGRPQAVADRCSHRHAPLSQGQVVGDEIVCPYHGIRFDGAGRCTHVPSQRQIPPEADIGSFPAVERHGWVWLWMGDPALADPAPIGDYHWLTDPGWRFKGETLNFPGNYMLVIDNLLDLTHTAFVHASLSIPELPDKPIRVDRRDTGLNLTRWVLDCAPPPMFRALMQGRNIDRAQITDFEAPSLIRHWVLTAPAGSGAPEGDLSAAINFRTCVAVTPETADTSHYFRMSGHDFQIDDPTITEFLFATGHGAMVEDQWIIGAQRDNMAGPAGNAPPWVDFNQDAAALEARRINQRLIERERAPGRQAAAE